jgi:tetratricopeptide (TPR) repeat protein
LLPVGLFISISSAIVYDINNRISFLRNVVLLLPRSHPERTRALFHLANVRVIRYGSSQQPDDLESSIFCLAEAIFLPLPLDMRPLFLTMFCNLTVAVLQRAEEFRRPEDVTFCIMCLRYLRGQVHHKLLSPNPLPIAELLIRALAIQVESSFGDVGQDVEEMADLCDELLNSEIPIQPPISANTSKEAVSLPDSHRIPLQLATSLYQRWCMTHSDDNYKAAMAIMDKLICFRAPDDTTSPHRREAVELAAKLAMERLDILPKPEYLEQAIYRLHNLHEEIPYEDERRELLPTLLLLLEALRFNDSHATTQGTKSSTSGGLPSFRDLSATFHEVNEVRPSKMLESRNILDVPLYSMAERLTDIADIQDSIHYFRQVIASNPSGELAFYAQSVLVLLLQRAFKCTGQIDYLNEAISAVRQNFNAPVGQAGNILQAIPLFLLLQMRLTVLHREEDFDELMQLFHVLARCESINPHVRLQISWLWASHARHSGHHSASIAYDVAMSSMQASLTFAPTLDLQHSLLVAMGDALKAMPLDYASHQIHTGQLERAIETLERGRVLLWSEMRGLRTSMDQIRLANPGLADKFDGVNKELEAVTMAISLDSNIIGGGGGSGLEGMDPYGRHVLRQRKLLDDREKLISKVQAMPGFDTFLKPPSFNTLYSSAFHGPVIIINHSWWRSDIIILLRNASPSLIHPPDNFYCRAIKLQDRLLEEREKGVSSDTYEDKGLSSDTYEDTLRWVLKELYDLVGRPVVRRLNELAYQNNLEYGGAQPLYFAHFRSTRWVQSHQSLQRSALRPVPDISWTCTFPRILHLSPRSSSLVSLACKSSASLRCFSSYSQMSS